MLPPGSSVQKRLPLRRLLLEAKEVFVSSFMNRQRAQNQLTWCHCESCQRFHSAASAACMLFPIKIEDGELTDTAGKFQVIKGGDKIRRYHHSPDSITRRFFCQDCGSPVFNSIPAMGFVNTFPACFKGAIIFKPEFHSNYAEKIVTVHDGLPKYKGFVGSELVDDEGRLIAN